ncbi:SEC-C metal-binding domain-containing protein [Anaeromicrobium sediminis]|uniref:SEC-C domain-containing protein n=1 Tax=Anaeromicrobium sediminis TaxID=1478221 RepID=A0A267MPF4_9FIRM|nr:SEC-C metal-binding domain-containing protein [Anaeromicrobium sediminis]PAB60785.1 hypothetical protein CCE28_04405 [Anaeromicrobium sediminis]
MSLFENWKDMAYKHTSRDTFEKFWGDYAKVEGKIYANLLENHEEKFEGTVKGLAEKFETTNEYIVGFLDGINESIKEGMDLEGATEDTAVSLEVNYEKLFFNMLEARADYLYNLPQWAGVLSVEERENIVKKFKKSKTVVNENKVGRNDPCPCGSGKKHKKCCLK